jgi:hypothetical protein
MCSQSTVYKDFLCTLIFQFCSNLQEYYESSMTFLKHHITKRTILCSEALYADEDIQKDIYVTDSM